MTIDDPLGLDAASIERAREEFYFAARAVQALGARSDWDEHQAVVYLAFYLTRADYEIKVLVDRVWREPENRAVWEKYLALEIHEAVESLPKLIGQALRPERPMRPELRQVYLRSFQAYKEAVAPIKRDQRFWQTLMTLRNEVAAHHGGKKGRGLTTYVGWALNSHRSEESGLPILRSQILEYGYTLGSAIQDFAAGIGGGSSTEDDRN